MKTTTVTAIAVFLAGASAEVAAQKYHEQCYYTLWAKGEKVNGPLTQIPDGQIQIHEHEDKHSCAKFTIEDDYHMYDSQGRGCIVTEPQKQIQCDHGNDGDDAFKVYSDILKVWHDATAWACPINDHGDWNVYTDPIPGQMKCTPVTIYAESSCDKEHDHDDHDNHNDDHHNDDHNSGHNDDHYGDHNDDHNDSENDDNCDDCEHKPCATACTVTQHYTKTQKYHHTATATVTEDCDYTKPCTISKPTSMPQPKPKPTPMPAPDCHHCHHYDNPCHQQCKTKTWTSTTTSMVTVVKETPVPCKHCHGQDNCMKTCTVVATATATTTVWKPCAEQCKGDFKCFDNCHQPRPTCGAKQDCSGWDKEFKNEDWGWKPRPANYDGYWPYDKYYKGRPEAYGGYWKNDLPQETESDELTDRPSKRAVEAAL